MDNLLFAFYHEGIQVDSHLAFVINLMIATYHVLAYVSGFHASLLWLLIIRNLKFLSSLPQVETPEPLKFPFWVEYSSLSG